MYLGGAGAIVPQPYVRCVSIAVALGCGLDLQLYNNHSDHKGITIWIPAYQITTLPIAFVTFN